MPVVGSGNIALSKGVPATLYEATSDKFPGVFSGKVDLNGLTDAADEIKITLYTKYSELGSYLEAESPDPPALQADKIFRITPTEEYYGYKLVIELTSDSVSNNASLPYVIIQNAVVE